MPEIYVDVTATAHTLHHTGIQRVVRSIARCGSIRANPVAPVAWDGRRGFRSLKPTERQRLFDVFSRAARRKGLSDLLWDGLSRTHRVRWNRFGGRSTLLIPEIPSGGRLAALSALARSFQAGPEMVGICHDLLSWSHPEFTHPDRATGFVAYLRFLCRLDRVLCPSRTTADEFLRFQKEEGVAGPEPEVVPWPVDGEPQPLPEETGEPLILCVGTLEARKNHECFLDACEVLWTGGSRFRVQLVGRLRAKGEDRIPARVGYMRERGRPISWSARVDDDQLDRFYREARFTVFPSVEEGYGLPVAESLARGRPCVCSGKGAVGEIARGGGCETVDVTDPSDLTSGIFRMLEDEARYRKFAEEAAGRAWPDWDQWLDRVFPEEGDDGDSDDWT